MFRVSKSGYNKFEGRDAPKGGIIWITKKQRNS